MSRSCGVSLTIGGGYLSTQSQKDALEALEQARGGTNVIAYLTSTRPGWEGQMSLDAIPVVYRHLREILSPPQETVIDLFIHSNGGDGTVPWRLVTLLREFCQELNVLIPHRAFSAATLTALGADSVIMHPMGMLGPTDPSIIGPYNPPNPFAPQQNLPISVEDVASYIALVKEDVGIRHEDELIKAFIALTEKVHPLALGNVKRTTSQSRMLGDKLLRRRKDQLSKASIEEIMRKLNSELFSHGHPINAREAREDLGLGFVHDANGEVAEAMWNVYEEFDLELQQDNPFNALREAIAVSPLAVPTAPGPNIPVMPSMANVKLGPLVHAFVESRTRSDAFQSESEMVITRDQMGNYASGQVQLLSQEWVQRR